MAHKLDTKAALFLQLANLKLAQVERSESTADIQTLANYIATAISETDVSNDATVSSFHDYLVKNVASVLQSLKAGGVMDAKTLENLHQAYLGIYNTFVPRLMTNKTFPNDLRSLVEDNMKEAFKKVLSTGGIDVDFTDTGSMTRMPIIKEDNPSYDAIIAQNIKSGKYLLDTWGPKVKASPESIPAKVKDYCKILVEALTKNLSYVQQSGNSDDPRWNDKANTIDLLLKGLVELSDKMGVASRVDQTNPYLPGYGG